MESIDGLLGEALAGAVARARGWTIYSGDVWVKDAPGVSNWYGPVADYRPDIDMSLAWEMVSWMTEEHNIGVVLSREEDGTWSIRLDNFKWLNTITDSYKAWVEVFNASSAEVAICRAFLKLKEAWL